MLKTGNLFWTIFLTACAGMFFFYSSALNAAEPALPTGLEEGNGEQSADSEKEDNGGESGAPALPSGLGDDGKESEPDNDDEEKATARAYSDFKNALNNITGFAEIRAGTRIQSDAVQDESTVAETRLQLQTDQSFGPVLFDTTVDFLYDDKVHPDDIDLEDGKGWLDIRKMSLSFTPLQNVDMSVGRQVLTWGTGDLIFINDMFPKDWQSFFIGRDSEYLKAPSDALTVSIYGGTLPNLDIVYTPRFDTDRYVSGRRLSFWNPMLLKRTGEDNVIDVDKPDGWFDNDEIALRLFKNIKSYEVAAYYYNGYWKSPAGMDQSSGQFTFPELSVYGASVRGSFAAGIGYLEAGYYDSREDRSGDDPAVANSQMRFLAGYKQELKKNLTATVQYYAEYLQDHSEYLRNLPSGAPARDEVRHTFTLRLRQELMRDNLTVSVFSRYSPNQDDAYFRPQVSYKLTDDWLAEVGADLFVGQHNYTFLGQFEDNSNIHFALRYFF